MSTIAPIARIHVPSRSAMQSGKANPHSWVLEYAPTVRAYLDPLTGWSGSSETRRQLRLEFNSLEEARDYAESRGIAFEIWDPPALRQIVPKIYADNFRTDRRDNWTH